MAFFADTFLKAYYFDLTFSLLTFATKLYVLKFATFY